MADDAIRKGRPVRADAKDPACRPRRREVRDQAEVADGDADDVGQALILPEHSQPRSDRSGNEQAPLSACRRKVLASPSVATICTREKDLGRERRSRSAAGKRAMTPSGDWRHRSCRCALAAGAGGRALDGSCHAVSLPLMVSQARRQMPTIVPVFPPSSERGDWQGDPVARRPTIAVGAVTLALCVGSGLLYVGSAAAPPSASPATWPSR